MTLNIGEKILDRFNIISMLGRGGFGSVYLAQDLRLDRHVAIKELESRLLGGSILRKRFVTEAQLMARLHHPNVVSIFELFDPSSDQVNEYLIVISFSKYLVKPPVNVDITNSRCR